MKAPKTVLVIVALIGASHGACPGNAPEAGTYTYDMMSGGLQRKFTMTVPVGYDNTVELPLVFDNHGFTQTGNGQDRSSNFRAKADAEHFLLIQADGFNRQWNCGCLACGGDNGADDVLFHREMVEFAANVSCVDRNRVYATGFSVGGFMAHRLGWEAADVFAAVAPHSGSICAEHGTPSRPIPIWHTHGTSDSVVPYDGPGLFFPSAPENLEIWGGMNGCERDSVEVTWDGTPGSSVCETYTRCQGGVTATLCSLDGVGHVWYNGGLAGAREYYATDQIWDFLSQWSLDDDDRATTVLA